MAFDLRSLRYFLTVAEERHFGRAANRLHMSQPPLSRAIANLEAELGTTLLVRSPRGVSLTPPGQALQVEARRLLEQADRIRNKIADAAGTTAITIGTLADTAEQVGTDLIDAFRARHPKVDVSLRESDLTDPATGLRSGLVDVAITRLPFDDDGIETRVLRHDPIGVVLRRDDPFAGRSGVELADLTDRRWFQLPDDSDPVWLAFWNRAPAPPAGDERPLITRTVQECLQAALWSGRIGLAPLGQTHPEGLTIVPVIDLPASPLVVAWNRGQMNPLIRSFAHIAIETCA